MAKYTSSRLLVTGANAGSGAASASTLDQRATRAQPRRDQVELRAVGRQLDLVNRAAPDLAGQRIDQRGQRIVRDDPPAHHQADPRAQIGHVIDDVDRQDHDHALADLGQQVVEPIALLRVEPRGRLVDDDQLGPADQRLRDAEALAHAAREPSRSAALRSGYQTLPCAFHGRPRRLPRDVASARRGRERDDADAPPSRSATLARTIAR